MRVNTCGFEFRFTDAVDAFVFDEKDKAKTTFHGAPMKAVDIIVELESSYLYVEIKDYDDSSLHDILNASPESPLSDRQKRFNWLKGYLKYKFRDSYLYRHAEDRVEKPIHYICLVNFNNALNSRIQKSLKREIPVGRPSPRWLRTLARSCKIVNLDKWNENFPKWPVKRLDTPSSSGEKPSV